MNPSISILLPVHNAAATLATTLRSIARQKRIDWECLILDDGSSDPSLAIARSAAEADPRFRVFVGAPSRTDSDSEPRARPGKKRTHRAHGCGRLDASRPARSASRPARKASRALRRGLLCPDLSTRCDARWARQYEAWLHSLVDADTLWRNRFIECPVAHPTLMIRKEAFGQTEYRDVGWPEDYDLLLRLLKNGPCVGMVPRRLLGWRDHPDRLPAQTNAMPLPSSAAVALIS